jgi:hypothetical protein
MKPGDIVSLLEETNFMIATNTTMCLDEGVAGRIVSTSQSGFFQVQFVVSENVYITTCVHMDTLKLEPTKHW